MPAATRSHLVLCRAVAGGLALVAAGAAVMAVVLFPPVLERWILVDGDVGRTAAVAACIGGSVVLLAAGLRAALAARRLWSKPEAMPLRRLQLALMATGLGAVAALAAAEVAARLMLRPEQVLVGDAIWIHRWLDRRGGETAAELDPRRPVLRFDPELGWASSENYRSEDMNTNSRGLRGLREHPIPKPRGVARIVVVGDSFTFGKDVRDEEVYTEVIDGLIDDASVVNLGVMGYGTDQQYLRLRRNAFEYEPDLVVVGFFGPNVERNILGFRDYAKPRFTLASGELSLANVPLPAPDDPTRPLSVPWPSFHSVAFARTSLDRALGRTVFAPKWAITRRLLDAILEETQRHDARLLLVHFPPFRNAFTRRPDDTEVVTRSWAEDRGVPFHAIRPTFAQLPAEERKDVFDSHWTAMGHRVVGRDIARVVESGGLLRTAGK